MSFFRIRDEPVASGEAMYLTEVKVTRNSEGEAAKRGCYVTVTLSHSGKLLPSGKIIVFLRL